VRSNRRCAISSVDIWLMSVVPGGPPNGAPPIGWAEPAPPPPPPPRRASTVMSAPTASPARIQGTPVRQSPNPPERAVAPTAAPHL
jgi:hypothetical protein